ncbi:MAG: hypothetical protein M1840_005542 [Geoglossum simile]|nr:MAG: hypothetical protein M1840_005542 [Geoglossum simile]
MSMSPTITPTTTATPTRPADPIDMPTCQDNVVGGAPPMVAINNAGVDLNSLLMMLREVICNDGCSVPPGFDPNAVRTTSTSENAPDCEIAVGLSDSVEAYVIRNSHSQGEQQPECWDSTEFIINKCVKNGPNTGWWSGEHADQFYQLGVRPLNGEGNKHTDKPFSPNEHLGQAPAIPPSPSPAPPAPPTPSQTSCNNHGSGLCPEAESVGACPVAFARYSDGYRYTSYTSYTVSFVGDTLDPGGLLGFGNPGCAAMFTCNDDQAYAVGMTGKQIKDAFQNIFDHCKVSACGTAYLSNGCHVTVNGCRECKNSIPADAPQ